MFIFIFFKKKEIWINHVAKGHIKLCQVTSNFRFVPIHIIFFFETSFIYLFLFFFYLFSPMWPSSFFSFLVSFSLFFLLTVHHHLFHSFHLLQLFSSPMLLIHQGFIKNFQVPLRSRLVPSTPLVNLHEFVEELCC